VADDSSTAWLGPSAGASRLSARQAAAFLDVGISGVVRSHYSASSFLSLQKNLTDMVEAVPPAALVPLHALSIVGAVPGHLAIELGEGFLFGWQKGFALALSGKFLGAVASFGIARSAVVCGCMKDRLKSYICKWPLCQKVANGVENGGGFSVFVIRLAPVPCVVKNYSIALLTDIPIGTYLLASFAGLLPTTAAHVYAGTLAPSVAALASGASHISGAQALTLASPVVAGVLLNLIAGYYLHQYVIADSEDKEDEDKIVELEKRITLVEDSINKNKLN